MKFNVRMALRVAAALCTLAVLEVVATIHVLLKWATLLLPSAVWPIRRVLTLLGRQHVTRQLWADGVEEEPLDRRGAARAGCVHGVVVCGKLASFYAVPYATAERFRHATLHTDSNDAAFKAGYPRPWFAPPWWSTSLINANAPKWAPVSGALVMALTEQPMLLGLARTLWAGIRGRRYAWGDEAQAMQLTVHQPLAAAGSRDKKRPVLVFIHGGAFVTMSSYMPLHRCEQLAATTGCVVVSIEYRQGILGFAGFDDPRAGCDANCGLTDCETALRWVRRYIHNFDGDVGRVTIMGQSAGSMLCSSLAAMPRCRDLFRNIILLSGVAQFTLSRADAQATLRRFAAKLRLDDPNDQQALAKALRATPLQELMRYQAKVEFDFQRDFRQFVDLDEQRLAFSPVVNSNDLPSHPLDTVVQNKSLLRDRTVVVSTTTAEYLFFLMMPSPVKGATPIADSHVARRIRHLFGEDQCSEEDAQRIIDTYRETRTNGWHRHNRHERAGVWAEVCADALFRLPSEAFADAVAEAGGRAVVCRFAEPALFPRGIQAAHAVDLHYWLGNRLVPPFWAGALPAGRHARRFAQVSGAMMELVGDVCWGRHVAAPAWRRRSEGPRGPVTVFGDAGGASRPEQAPVSRVAETCEAACAGDDARSAVWGDLHDGPRTRTRDTSIAE